MLNSMRGERPFSSFVLPFRRQSRWLMPQGREKCWAVLPMMTYKGGALPKSVASQALGIWIAFLAGVFRGARISSLPTNACSTENNIPFLLFNQQFSNKALTG